MNLSAIYKLHPQVVRIIGDEAFDSDGNTVEYNISDVLFYERKQALINELEAEYEAAKSAPIEYLNTTFQADKVSRETILEVLVAAGFTMPLGYEWRDINDAKVNVEGNLLHGLAQAILMRAQPLFWEKSANKDAINACETDADLDLYLNPPV